MIVIHIEKDYKPKTMNVIDDILHITTYTEWVYSIFKCDQLWYGNYTLDKGTKIKTVTNLNFLSNRQKSVRNHGYLAANPAVHIIG